MEQRTRSKKKRVMVRKKRTLDENTNIDYKDTDTLKKFITERGKIIPRRVSGASAEQQRRITTEIKRARYLAMLPFSISHRQEKKIVVEAALTADAMGQRPSHYDRDDDDRSSYSDSRGSEQSGSDTRDQGGANE